MHLAFKLSRLTLVHYDFGIFIYASDLNSSFIYVKQTILGWIVDKSGQFPRSTRDKINKKKGIYANIGGLL